MAKKIVWLRGQSPDQFNARGEAMEGPHGFLHARKPRTSKTTLCGVKIVEEIEVIPEAKVKKMPTNEFCHECRMRLGLIDRFGRMADPSSTLAKQRKARIMPLRRDNAKQVG